MLNKSHETWLAEMEQKKINSKRNELSMFQAIENFGAIVHETRGMLDTLNATVGQLNERVRNLEEQLNREKAESMGHGPTKL